MRISINEECFVHDYQVQLPMKSDDVALLNVVLEQLSFGKPTKPDT